ncbi:MAG: hypothetical protein Q9164_005974, partial [Protoblastenia rupestris]
MTERSKAIKRRRGPQLPHVSTPAPAVGRPQIIELENRLRSAIITSDHERSENMATTQSSHSELGAGLSLIGNVWRRLRLGQIELSTKPATARQWARLTRSSKLWKNFLQQPAEIALSLLLSAIFVGLFVAQSSGSVLSARIVSDGMALSTSPGCLKSSEPTDGAHHGGFSDYSEKCYHAPLGADGCTLFYNQSISYTEQAGDKCPFSETSRNRCIGGMHGPVTFDTGFIDVKYLGINAASQKQFRRRTTCTPAVLRDIPKDIDFLPGKPPCGKFLVSKYCTKVWGLGEAYDFVSPMKPNISDGTLNVYITRICTHGVPYSEYRDDPLFPAQYPISPGSSIYSSDAKTEGMMVCFDNSSICESNQKNCRDFTQPGLYQYSWKDSNTKITEEDLTLALLSRALGGSSICAASLGILLEAESLCSASKCEPLPPAQWKSEARHWFERSLASMQGAVFDTARGRYQNSPLPKDIPSNYRGMCQMVKFKSVGWRN